MSEDVTLTQVLQAVTELSQDLKATESRLNDRFDKVESRLTAVESKVAQVETRVTIVEEKVEQVDLRVGRVEANSTQVEKIVSENGRKIDKFDAKFSIVTDEILSTKADVKMLRDAK